MSERELAREGGEGPIVPGVAFFCDEMTFEANLMTFDCPEDIYHGELRSVVDRARRLLHEKTDQELRILLLFADLLLDMTLKDGTTFCDYSGGIHTLTEDVLSRLSPVDVAVMAFGALERELLIIHEESGDETEVEVTASGLYAAIALREAFAVAELSVHPQWLASLGGCRAMIAAQAVSIAELLAVGGSPFTPIAAKQTMTERARAGAYARLARDPKQAAKLRAREMWEAWQRGDKQYKSGAAFARHVVDQLPIESTKTVERWIVEWREESRNSAS